MKPVSPISSDQMFFDQTAALAAFSLDSVKVKLESDPQRIEAIKKIETLLQKNLELKSLVNDKLLNREEIFERRRAPLAVVAQRLLLESLDGEIGAWDNGYLNIKSEDLDQYFNSFVKDSYVRAQHEGLIKDFDNLVGLLDSESSEAKNFKNLHSSAVRSYIQDYMYEASGEAEADCLFMDTPLGAT